MHPLVITGASGRLGGRVAQRLADRGLGLRLLGRDLSRLPDLPGADRVTASYDDPEAARRALEGAETVLMVSAAEQPDRVAAHRAFVDAIAASGARRVVYTSFLGASPTATFTLGRDHWATEEHIKASGLEWTFLRDNLYADFFPFMVGEDGVLRGPAGDGRVSAVATDDIADVAAAVLADIVEATSSAPSVASDPHVGQAYPMTGPQALTLDEVAAVIAAATGREVRFHNESVDEAYASRAVYDAPDWQVEAWVSTYTAIAAGEMAAVTDDIERLTGHPATSLAELLRRES